MEVDINDSDEVDDDKEKSEGRRRVSLNGEHKHPLGFTPEGLI